MWHAWAVRLISLLVVLSSAVPAAAASRFDPGLRFRRIATEHFVIYFHRGEERLAARLARIAEDVRRRLEPTLGVPRQRRTHIVLVDQSELANGWATPVPYNTIAIYAASPSGAEPIGNTDDWLQLVFAHEYAHIVHLDRSHGWSRIARAVFGRTPLALPNLFLPVWQIEGLATLEESSLTSGGRLQAGDFGAIQLEAARVRAVEPLDRINGGLTSWPAGQTPYAYGSGFHEYLVGTHGAETLGRLSDATTRRVPFFTAGAFKKVYGNSLDALWREYRATLLASVDPLDRPAIGTRITRHGFEVAGPRFLRQSCSACPREVVYSVRTPHEFPTLNVVSLDGSRPREITTRYLGSASGVGRGIVVFDQQELRRSVGLYSDLYSVELETGDVSQLTDGKRLLDPDLSPDGGTIVAVREGLGRREVITLPMGRDEVTVLLSEADTQFNAPRWSPDGRAIAVERHRPGAESEIVVADVSSGAVRVVASAPRTRYVTPAWRPDGRAVVVAGAAADEPFNLHEIEIENQNLMRRQLTHTTGGATWPDVSPDGKTIVFVGYTVDGFDLFSMPYPSNPPDGALQSAVVAPVVNAPAVPAELADTNTRRYNPLPTLMPTSWLPIVETDGDRLRLGAGIAGFDVLGYHAYSAAATWRVDTPSHDGGAAPLLDWTLAYAYDRWVPTLFANASWETSFAAVTFVDAPGQLVIPVRSRELEGGVLMPFRRVRVTHQALVSLNRTDDRYELVGQHVPLNRTAARVGWATSSAKVFGFSISPERGVTVGGTGESVLDALGSSASASTITGDLRAYLPGPGAHHVVALRAAAGASSGDRAAQRVFLLGGASPSDEVLDFDNDAISLLRGFESNAFAGSRVALLNAEYRWPLGRPERGYKTWPVFLHTAHAAVFGDAGHAWSDEFRLADAKTSLGGELSADVVLGYSLRLTVTAGAAWGHDGQRGSDHATAYLRIGRAF
jgi:WD40-like Beta Propeller Repeat